MLHNEQTNYSSSSLSNGDQLSDVNNYSLPAQTKISWRDVVACGNRKKFLLPSHQFRSVTDAYMAIEYHLGEADGFRNLSKYETQRSAQLILVARFRHAEVSRKTLSEGFVYSNMVFKATSSMVHAESSLVRLQLALLHIPSKATFLEDLLSSLNLDEQGIPLPIQALQRNLYLAWDTFAQAVYKGAELVCYYCRKAGHIRAKCPLMQKQVCYVYGKNRHTRRFCKRVEDNKGNLLDKFIQDTQALTVSVSDAVHSTSATELKTASPVLQTEKDLLDELCEALDAESSMDMEPDQTRKPDGPDFNRHDGTLASKHAPLEIGYAMHIDPKDQSDVQTPTILAKGREARTRLPHQPIGLSLVLTNMSISLDERCIYASFCDLNYRLVCQVINVYALSQPADRLHFYDSFLSLPFVPEAPTDPFLVISDFNMDFYAIHDHYPLAFRLRFDWLQEHFANCFTERVPTFKSSDCCSCIDYMYGLRSIHSRLTDALNTFLPTAWTDHSLLIADLLPSHEDMGPGA
ncbi:hypothetical protein G6F37_010294 [Rhizopus arrhizus]|nr:hypothetical protein G6F38_010346 [Rhizopus arrhizus]KAG1153511.1 hypothetical protein G6F37_010294 [Rhizopus arrhizus]